MPASIYRLGGWACEEIARKAFNVEIAKALNPLDPTDFIIISARLASSLRGAVADDEAKALKAAIETLDVDWPNLSTAQRAKIVSAARAEIAGASAAMKPAGIVLDATGATVTSRTRAAAISKYGLDLQREPTTADENVSELLRQSQMLYIKDEYGRRADLLDQQAKGVVASGLERGLGRDDISEELGTKLAPYQVNRSRNYWNLIATDFANKSRSTVHLGVMDEAGIARYRFEAVLDEATSSICRLLHGKVFSVPKVREQLVDSLNADDPEEIKDSRPWVQSGKRGDQEYLYFTRNGRDRVVADVVRSGVGAKNDTGDFDQRMSDQQLQAAGVTVPPMHGHCRSSVVADV